MFLNIIKKWMFTSTFSQRKYLKLIVLLMLEFFRGDFAQQIGFHVHKASNQRILKPGLTQIGQWDLQLSSTYGRFISGVNFDADGSSAIVPRSGIYSVFVNIRILNESSKRKFEFFIKTSLSDRRLTALSEGFRENEYCISGSLRLSIGEKIKIFLSTDQTGLEIDRKSTFSLQFHGYYGLLPSFLASPVRTSRYGSNTIDAIINWMPYHESIAGFSTINAAFVPANDAKYLCSLLLVLKEGYGSVRVQFQTGQQILFSLVRNLLSVKSLTIHISKIFHLQKDIILGLKVKALDGSVIISRKTTYSCVLVDTKNKFISLQLVNSTTFNSRNDFTEIAFWNMKQQTPEFKFLKKEGKVFFQESVALVSLQLTVLPKKNNNMTIAIVPGGIIDSISDDQGIVKTIALQRDHSETLSLTGLLRISGDSYISVFLKTKYESNLKVTKAEFDVILKPALASSILCSLTNPGDLPNKQVKSWTSMSINKKINKSPFRINSEYWYIADKFFYPKKYGIYYVTVNLVTNIMMQNTTEDAIIEAKIISKFEHRSKDLQYFLKGADKGVNTMSLTGVFLLQVNEKLSIVYRCGNKMVCRVSEFSGFSAVFLAQPFRAQGFSTSFTGIKKKFTGKSLGPWESSKANFMITKHFDASSGVYHAAYDGIYLISCNIIIRNHSSDADMKLEVKTQSETQNNIKQVSRRSFKQNGENGAVIEISCPLFVLKGKPVFITLITESKAAFYIDKRSTFSVVVITQSGQHPPPGFTMSLLRPDSVFSQRGRILRGWTPDQLRGGFINKDASYYQFMQQQGTILVHKPGVLLLNAIIKIRTGKQQSMSLSVRVNDNNKDLRSISTIYPDIQNTLKLSIAIFVKAGERLSVEIKRKERDVTYSYYQIQDDSVLSSVFLPESPDKPGLLLQIVGYKTRRKNSQQVFQYKLDIGCAGCYQQNLRYKEEEGYFEIPFAGRYLFSLNLRLNARKQSRNSTIKCGLWRKINKQLTPLTEKTFPESNFDLGQILEFGQPSKVAFVCDGQISETINANITSYISITFLDYRKVDTTSDQRSKWIPNDEGYNSNEIVYNTTTLGPSILEIGLKPRRSSYVILHSNEKLLEVNTLSSSERTSFYIGCNIKDGSSLHLQWIGNQTDALQSGLSLYKVSKRLDGLSASLSVDEIYHPINQTWILITNWQHGSVLDFVQMKTQPSLRAGKFIAKQNGEYFLSAVVNIEADMTQERYLHVVIDGDFSKQSYNVPVCYAFGITQCTVALTATLHLQKWQSVGIYAKINATFDRIKVLKGSRLTVLLMDVGIENYIDDGPNVVMQPWPVYVDEPRVVQWTCDAVGSQSLNYTWKRISLRENIESVVSHKNHVTVIGKPEESGYYFCSVQMNKTIHNSIAAILNISDTDECNVNNTEGKKVCADNSICINTIGSYRCECESGYEGNGFIHCRDIDECQSNMTCHPNARCQNTIGSHKCTCFNGYTGDGKFCEDINECLGRPGCHNDSHCINTNGSYTCVCKKGFTGNGFHCENINECYNDIYPCDDKATCKDTAGSFACTCKAGWTGNGTICVDIDECETTNCTGNATCLNLPGSYRCKCNRGYKGDGFKHCESLGCNPPKFCAGEFKAAWWSRSPYLANSSSQEPIGLFKDLLTQVVVACCANCSQLSFVGPFNGSFDVENAIEGNMTVDFGCPLYGSAEQTLFRGFPFMPVVESPGIAFFIKDKPQEKSAVLGSLGSSWPILAITFLLACLSGVIIWFLDTVRNPTEFPNSFVEGSWEGFWWAFITMTTVGYGDKAPRSFGGRLFGILWILIGLVIISTFTATITTMLTTSSLSNEVKLYGTKVGALHNSEEYRLGVKRNAETKAYGSVAEIVQKVKEGEIEGILLDAYIAGEFQDDLRMLRLHQVIDYIFSYGVVLSRDGLALKECFNLFLESKQSQIYSTISKVIKPLKTASQTSYASEKSAGIFDAGSKHFKYTVYIGFGIFVLLLIIGVIWEYINSRRRSKNYTVTQVEEPQECEVVEWKVQWESGKVSHFHRNIFKNDISDLKQHIKDFAKSWIDRLDELETKQTKEMNAIQRSFAKTKQGKLSSLNFGNKNQKCHKDENNGHFDMLMKERY